MESNSNRTNFIQEIIEASINEELLIFIGAGISRICDCWGWDRLAKELVNELYEQRIISYRTSENLKNRTGYKEIISTSYNLFRQHHIQKEKPFWKLMEKALRYNDKIDNLGSV